MKTVELMHIFFKCYQVLNHAESVASLFNKSRAKYHPNAIDKLKSNQMPAHQNNATESEMIASLRRILACLQDKQLMATIRAEVVCANPTATTTPRSHSNQSPRQKPPKLGARTVFVSRLKAKIKRRARLENETAKDIRNNSVNDDDNSSGHNIEVNGNKRSDNNTDDSDEDGSGDHDFGGLYAQKRRYTCAPRAYRAVRAFSMPI